MKVLAFILVIAGAIMTIYIFKNIERFSPHCTWILNENRPGGYIDPLHP